MGAVHSTASSFARAISKLKAAASSACRATVSFFKSARSKAASSQPASKQPASKPRWLSKLKSVARTESESSSPKIAANFLPACTTLGAYTPGHQTLYALNIIDNYSAWAITGPDGQLAMKDDLHGITPLPMTGDDHTRVATSLGCSRH